VCFLCVFFFCVRVHVRACARVRAYMRACVSAYAFPSDWNFARVCSERVCVCSGRVGVPSHRTAGTCGITGSARAARCGRVLVVAFAAIGRARARRPQVSLSPIVPSRRNGLRDNRTRPWSTPPAPSTSSAAATATPTSTTCGRAPTEVRGRTKSRGRVVGGVLEGVPQGY
jgi:hypothetical protein